MVHMYQRVYLSICRMSITTQNVLAAVDFDLRFIYVLVGWEGSAHDSYVLQDALSRRNGLKIPEGKYFLADVGYAARPGILPPYHGTRYHLQEYRGTREQETPKELFNLRHSSLRTSVERAFGTLKNHFNIFGKQSFFPLKTQVKIVMACCALHNWILDDGPDEYAYDPSGTNQANKQRPRGKKSPTEKPQTKSRLAESTDEISATIKSLRETLVANAPPQVPQLIDPHATLWQKLEEIPMTFDQRVLVGELLSTKENKGKRGWLCSASADTLHAWVFKFLCEKEGINL